MDDITRSVAVTIVTAGAASADDLTDSDYRDIYEELRSRCALRQFADAIHSGVSFAWWSKYERREATLNHDRRAELRAAVGLPPLPPTIASVAATIDPDATVYRVGEGNIDRAILVGDRAPAPLTLRLNGARAVVADEGGETSRVTGVTPPRRARNTRGLSVRGETYERLSAARQAAGLTWDAYLSRLERLDDLVAALREVDRWLGPDLSTEAGEGESERLAERVRAALEAVEGVRR